MVFHPTDDIIVAPIIDGIAILMSHINKVTETMVKSFVTPANNQIATHSLIPIFAKNKPGIKVINK